MSDTFTSDVDIEADDAATLDESSEGPFEEGTPDEDIAAEGAGETSDEPTYTVKVDGEEIAVPLSELVAGYSRTADYTRKTQQLAEQRKGLADAQALMAALERDPAQTIAVLAQAYGLAGAGQAGGDEELLTDDERRVRDLERWRDQEVARAREAQIDNEVRRLHDTYGDFDEEALFQFAVQNNVMHLETALRAMQYDQAVVQARTRSDQKRVVKRAVGASNGSRSNVAEKQDDGDIASLADAFAYAKRLLSS